MKMVSVGFLKKIIDVDEQKLKKGNPRLDPMNQAVRIKRPVRLNENRSSKKFYEALPTHLT